MDNIHILKTPPKIAVLGDLLIDRYITGSTERLSSEAPIPVVRVKNRSVNMACAGNAIANIKALGGEPLMVGRIGSGEYGEEFLAEARRQNIRTDFTISTETPMGAKTRILVQGQQVARFDEDDKIALTEDERAQLLKKLWAARKEADTILLTDYGYRTIDAEIITAVKDIWSDGSIIMDPQAFHPVDFSGVSAVTPNLKEAKFILGNSTAKNTDEDTQDLANQLIEQFDLEYVLFTRSEKGMSLYEANGNATHVPACAKEVFDVCGAGDSVVAAFTVALGLGMSRSKAMEIANLAGSVAVTKMGVQTVSMDEVTALSARTLYETA